MAGEMDLSCSESSADFSSEGTSTPSTSNHSGESVLLEFNVLGLQEAKDEVERLLASESHSLPPAVYRNAPTLQGRERMLAVETICLVAEKLNYNFTTSVLAVSLLDRFLAASSNVRSWLLMLAAVACLSIAGKLEEVFHPPSNSAILYATLGDQACGPEHLTRMELAVLTVLGWRTLAVTPANLLDPLISLLDRQHTALKAAGGFQLACAVRESCKLALARILCDARFLRFKPSIIATATIFTALEEISYPVDLSPIAQPLLRFFGPQQTREIWTCRDQIRPMFPSYVVSSLFKDCHVEYVEEASVIRVSTAPRGTPQSVLRAPDDGYRSTPTTTYWSHWSPPALQSGMFVGSSYAEWQTASVSTPMLVSVLDTQASID